MRKYKELSDKEKAKMKKKISFVLCLALLVTTAFGTISANAGDSINPLNTETTKSSIDTPKDSEKTDTSELTETAIEEDDIVLNDGKEPNVEENDSDSLKKKQKEKSVSVNANSLDLTVTDVVSGSLQEKVDDFLINEGYNPASDGYGDIQKITISGSMSNVDYEFIRTNMATTLQVVDISGVSGNNVLGSAFEGCTGLQDVTISNNMTTVNGRAFGGCTSLININLDKVVSIGGSSPDTGAFSGCTSLTDVGNTENLISMNVGSFYNCTSLKKINLSSATNINMNAFYNCTSMNLDGDLTNLTTIGAGAFSNCKSITGEYSLENLETIGGSAFYNCSGLGKITSFGAGKIENSTFGNCTSLTAIDLSKVETLLGTTSYFHGVFAGCTSLKDVGDTINLKTVGLAAFKDCSSLEKINLSIATSINDYAFDGCKSMEIDSDLKTVTNIGTTAFRGCESITGDYSLEKLNTIKDYAFDKCSGIENITSFGATTISRGTFRNCTSLLSIDLSKVTTITGHTQGSDGAFASCTSLKSVGDTANLITVGLGAFFNCSSLENINLSNANTIGAYAFDGCVTMKLDSDLKSITKIGAYGFRYCKSITGSYSLEKLVSIGDYAFYYCKGLENITSFGATTIAMSSFGDCTSLSAIDLSKVEIINGHTAKGYGAFYNCTSLVDVGDTKVLTKLGIGSFNNCTLLKKINLSKTNTIGAYAFENCTSLNLDGDLKNVKTIGAYSFSKCKSITGEYSLENLSSIGDYAFVNCTGLGKITSFGAVTVALNSFGNCTSLTAIDLSKVEVIKGHTAAGYGAFYNCTSLSDIGNTVRLQSTGIGTFYNCTSLTRINLSAATSIGNQSFENCKVLEYVTFSALDTKYGTSAFKGCALDMSSNNPTNGYPNGTYTTSQQNTFANQHPRAYFSLTTTGTTIGLNGTYPDPAQVKTMYGADYKDLISKKAEWLDSGITIKTTVTPNPEVCASKSGLYDLTYSAIYNNKMILDNGVHALGFQLTVDGIPPKLTPGDGVRLSSTKGTADFTSDDDGEYYYIVMESSATTPSATDITKGGIKVSLKDGKNNITDSALTNSKDKIVYVIAVDEFNNWSDIISMRIPEWKWTLTIDVVPTTGGSIKLGNGEFTDETTSTALAAEKNINLTAKPDTGYVFSGWTNTSGGSFTTTKGLATKFTMPDNDEKVVAHFGKLIVKGSLVFKDKNGNGTFQAGIDEKYKDTDNIKVELFKFENNSWSTKAAMTADVGADGSYKFEGVAAGKYKVKAIVSEPYKTTYSDEFTVNENEHYNITQNLAVQAEATLKVEFINHNNDQVGDTVEIYGTTAGVLKDFTKDTNITAVLSAAGKGTHEVPVPEYEHYKIVGNATQNPGFDWDDPTTFDKTLTFKLQGNTYTVTFDGNEATTNPNPESMKVVYPTVNLTALPQAPTKKGHTFNGWNMMKDGSGAQFDLSTKVTKDITVYADWISIDYTLKFDLNGGDGKAPQSQTLKYGQTATKVADPSKKDSKFLSWNTKKDGKGSNWDFKKSTMPDSNVMLYAQWKDVDTTGTGSKDDDNNDNDGGTSGSTDTNNSGNDTAVNNAVVAGSQAEPATTTEQVPSSANDPQVKSNTVDGEASNTIGNTGVPLFDGSENTWALFNLIFAIAGAFLIVISAVMIFFRKKETDEEYEEKKYDFKWFIISIVVAIASIVLFFVTQDMTKQMALMDYWTIFNFALLILQMVFTLFLFRKSRKELNQDNQELGV